MTRTDGSKLWMICLGLLLTALPGLAGTVTVTTTMDVVAGPNTSLRDAFDIANSDGEATEIILAPGATYPLSICGIDDTNAMGDLDHTEGNLLEITGNGATIEQTCMNRVIHALDEAAVLTLDDVTITGGSAPDGFEGGGVRSLGLVNLFDSVVTDNLDGGMSIGDINGVFFGDLLNMRDSELSLNDPYGAGIGEGGALVEDSRIVDNLGDGIKPGADAVFDMRRTLVRGNMDRGVGGTDASISITGSIIHENGAEGVRGTSPGFAGLAVTIVRTAIFDNGLAGVECVDCQPLTVENSTISNNSIGINGVFNAVVDLIHATIVHNGDNVITDTPDQVGGSVLTTFASVIADVDAGGNDCALNGPVVSSGYNFDGDGSCGLGGGPGDQSAGGDPKLLPLKMNGGPNPAPSHLPTSSSPLVDTVPVASCVLPIDQRGVVRPADDGCDTGAIERSIPLYVVLESFTAEVTRRGVAIRWVTSAEIDNVGFRVLRETDGNREKAPVAIAPAFIHGKGSALHGADYEVVDPSRTGNRLVRYYLEDTDIWGVRTLHGPITVGSNGRRAAD